MLTSIFIENDLQGKPMCINLEIIRLESFLAGHLG